MVRRGSRARTDGGIERGGEIGGESVVDRQDAGTARQRVGSAIAAPDGCRNAPRAMPLSTVTAPRSTRSCESMLEKPARSSAVRHPVASRTGIVPAPVAAGETENELVVGTGMGLDGEEHSAVGSGRADGGETFRIKPIEGAETDDGIERPELRQLRQTIVVEFDQLSRHRRDEPRPLRLERRRIVVRDDEPQAAIGNQRLQTGGRDGGDVRSELKQPQRPIGWPPLEELRNGRLAIGAGRTRTRRILPEVLPRCCSREPTSPKRCHRRHRRRIP